MDIKINTENLIDSPYSESKKSAFVFEDDEFLEQIIQELKNAHPSVFLVSGYRGVGKTSFVVRVAEHLKADHIFASINVAKYEGYPHLVKRLIRQLYLSFDAYTKKQNVDQELIDEFALLYDRTFNDVVNNQLIREQEENKLEHTAALNLKKLFLPIAFALITVINLGLDLIPSRLTNTILAITGLIWSTLTTWKLAIKKTATETNTNESSRKSLYDDEIAEHYLLEILKKINENKTKVLIAFDELDKHDNITDVMRIIDDLKPLLLSGRANFFVIAGQQLSYHYEEAAMKENEVISSIFSKTIHIPFLSQATLKSYCLNLLIEEKDKKNELVLDFLDSMILHSRRIPRILVNLIRSNLQWQNNEAYLVLDEIKSSEHSRNAKLLSSLSKVTDQTLSKISITPTQLDFFTAQIHIWARRMIEYRSAHFLLSEVKDINSYKGKAPARYYLQLDNLGELLTDELLQKELLGISHSDDEEEESHYYWTRFNESPIEYRFSNDETGLWSQASQQGISSGDFITEFAEFEQLTRHISGEIGINQKQPVMALDTLLSTLKSKGVIGQKPIDSAKEIIKARNQIVHGERVGNEAIKLVDESIFNLRRLKAEILEDYVFYIGKDTLPDYIIQRDNRGNFDFVAESNNKTIAVDVKYRKKASANTSDVINAFRNFENFKKITPHNTRYVLFYFVAAESTYSKLQGTVRRLLDKDFSALKDSAEIVYISENPDESFKKIFTEKLQELAAKPEIQAYSVSPGFNQFEAKENLTKEFLKYIQDYFLFEALYSHSIVNNTNIERDLLSIQQNDISPNLNHIYSLWQSSYKILRHIETLKNRSESDEQNNLDLITSYIYYVMIGLWGDVPLLSELSGHDVSFAPPRVSAVQVRDTNISQLKDLLHKTKENTSHYIQAASIIAKYYLETKDYYAVSEYTKSIINAPNFSLAVTDEIFDTEKEAIMGHNLREHKDIQNSEYVELCGKGKYIHIIRNTEILLMAAEASFHLGNYDDATNFINKLKRRNNKEAIDKINEDFITILIDEWRENLGGEGSYFLALKRNELATSELHIEEYKLLLPIPQQELVLNPNMMQNPGY
ncbi:RagB/SusD family nutrient uptake outer membrane protein [Parapedobacter lycopersici]|uniref:RagB/SusD family nutrient uptake outer membrane protein n=1 Tax=Parapedobacter lycopersici TaxID=1864939 RepID=UPI00214D5681|nr:RagB/SusD family nutrient uptake outer membrane protein [Parapedobacter lycopersici]